MVVMPYPKGQAAQIEEAVQNRPFSFLLTKIQVQND